MNLSETSASNMHPNDNMVNSSTKAPIFRKKRLRRPRWTVQKNKRANNRDKKVEIPDSEGEDEDRAAYVKKARISFSDGKQQKQRDAAPNDINSSEGEEKEDSSKLTEEEEEEEEEEQEEDEMEEEEEEDGSDLNESNDSLSDDNQNSSGSDESEDDNSWRNNNNKKKKKNQAAYLSSLMGNSFGGVLIYQAKNCRFYISPDRVKK